jgi:hypothetical protein
MNEITSIFDSASNNAVTAKNEPTCFFCWVWNLNSHDAHNLIKAGNRK